MLTYHHATKPALGSEATIVLIAEQSYDPTSLIDKLWREIFLFERSFSRFLPGSELSRFNRQAGVRSRVSPAFSRLLKVAKTMSINTDGLYNPFILPALQRAGYKASAMPGYEHDQVDDFSNRQVVPVDRLTIGDDWAEIPYGTAIDMGGIGKGYLADQMADMIDTENLPGYWLSFGGDMVLCGHDENGKPWAPNIQSAYQPDAHSPVIIQLSGERQAVATSGTFKRPNQSQREPWHHLIDPRSGQPADTDVLLATVLAKSCMKADVLASCAVLVGSSKVLNFMTKQDISGQYIQARKNTIVKSGRMLIDKKIAFQGAKSA